MAHLENRRFVIDGKPQLVLSGEVHYFRLDRKDWHDRILKTKQAGCNAVASYIPWLFHEEIEGDIDVTGRKRPEHDLGAFIDLCHREGLWFIARPGPFIMAEVKNEGIPDWIYQRCPDAIPTTWGGKKATSKTLSYLNPTFLKFVKRWYSAVMPILAPRLDSNGGPVISVQLDNEIGMLQCWTEEADLSEDVLCDFTGYVQKKYSHEQLKTLYPFDVADPASRAKHLEDATFETARTFHSDYTEVTRQRFSKYAAKLREFAEAEGVKGIPFLINIHGSGGGRATTFPIGISQTFRSYTQEAGYWGSSDHYLGELTRQNAGDLYFLNAFMACVNRPEQPLSSVEFEAGTGDYGENGAVRQSGAATDFKARLSVVQGNRLLNHYLIAGGHNPKLEKTKQDGNSRIGTTGGRHGFAAPISPEGRLDPTYFALKDTNHTLSAVGHLLADMDEEHDPITLGFVPDYYSTDVKRPGPIRDFVSSVEGIRGMNEGLVRSMLACGFSFPAINLQAAIPTGTKAIAFASATCLHSDIQASLVDFVSQGGHLLLYGRIPVEDLEGHRVTILADALHLHPEPYKNGTADYFPSITGIGWAKNEPEIRAWQIPPFRAEHGEPFLQLTQTDLMGGTTVRLGKGTCTVVTAELPLHMSLWHGIFDRMSVKPTLRHDAQFGGVLLHRIRNSRGERFISLINLDQEHKDLNITEGEANLFGGKVFLAGRTAKLLPLGVVIHGHRIVRSTAEIAEVGNHSISFRQSLEPEVVEIDGTVDIDTQTARFLQTDGNSRLIEILPGRGLTKIQTG